MTSHVRKTKNRKGVCHLLQPIKPYFDTQGNEPCNYVANISSSHLATLPAKFIRGYAPGVAPRPQGFWTNAPGSPAKTPSHSETLQASSITDWDGGVMRNKLGCPSKRTLNRLGSPWVSVSPSGQREHSRSSLWFRGRVFPFPGTIWRRVGGGQDFEMMLYIAAPRWT